MNEKKLNEDPKISVIIPGYNVEKYLRECLESVINQTLRDIEIICINDGSTDTSLSILKEFAERDARIKIIDQENFGVSKARNVGIQSAKGKYVYFLDSDDYIEHDMMENIFSESEKYNLDVLYFNGIPFFEAEHLKSKYAKFLKYYDRRFDFYEETDGKTLYQKMYSTDAYKPHVSLQFFKRDFLLKSELSFPEGFIHEDNIFSFLCILKADRAKYINEFYFHRRVRENSIVTRNVSAENLRGYLICLFHMLQFVRKNSFNIKVLNTIKNHLAAIHKEIINIYFRLSPEEKNRFRMTASPSEIHFFKMNFFINRIGRAISWLPRKLHQAQKGSKRNQGLKY